MYSFNNRSITSPRWWPSWAFLSSVWYMLGIQQCSLLSICRGENDHIPLYLMITPFPKSLQVVNFAKTEKLIASLAFGQIKDYFTVKHNENLFLVQIILLDQNYVILGKRWHYVEGLIKIEETVSFKKLNQVLSYTRNTRLLNVFSIWNQWHCESNEHRMKYWEELYVKLRGMTFMEINSQLLEKASEYMWFAH